MKVISCGSQKGGTGKSTTAINLAACLARMNRRVLLVDLDHQANATNHLGQNSPDDEIQSSYALLAEKVIDTRSTIVPIAPNLQMIPGHIALAEVDIKLFSAMNREARLARALAQVENEFDYAIIDCPPSLGITTVNAFCASTHIIVCIQTNWFAYEALKRLMAIVDEVMSESNPNLVTYALATIHRNGVNLNKDVLSKIQETFKDLALRTVIRHTTALAEASAAHQAIIDFANGSYGHRDYQQLSEEIIERVEQQSEEEIRASRNS